MQLTYTVLSTTNFTTSSGSTLTVSIGNKADATVTGPGMPVFSFPIENPQASDISTYAVGASVTLTIAAATATS
ncbi:hypothetical protein [Beijerinckia sp. L45]|uniref:hypothetical protein n=1 Tax=Beijerinckia sp. L45 TaxID=1641855 RepID=UPI00131C6FF3|nr:hypothetical protein [Beijerinckia sp. L45]